jgi:hypothetical protein
MSFLLPPFRVPDFAAPSLAAAPLARFLPAPAAGVAPEAFHATTIFPEYFQLAPGDWHLAGETRMDCVVVRQPDGTLAVHEFRHLRKGELVAVGRSDAGEEGIYVHSSPFADAAAKSEAFAFRTLASRESPCSSDYDELYALLRHEREHGFILWVAGPALVFDRDARRSFVQLIENGFVHGLLAGNALAVHDVEAALFGTALGQGLYGGRGGAAGHYRHLDALNAVRRAGSLRQAQAAGLLGDGLLQALLEHDIPWVLAGSIRDDGPLPDVVSDACLAQDRMRQLCREATTVIGLATQLHTIATGNMVPCFRVQEGGQIRPIYFYTVDISEFAATKLANRGSLTARAILTNVQDFVVTLERGLNRRCR